MMVSAWRTSLMSIVTVGALTLTACGSEVVAPSEQELRLQRAGRTLGWRALRAVESAGGLKRFAIGERAGCDSTLKVNSKCRC